MLHKTFFRVTVTLLCLLSTVWSLQDVDYDRVLEAYREGDQCNVSSSRSFGGANTNNKLQELVAQLIRGVLTKESVRTALVSTEERKVSLRNVMTEVVKFENGPALNDLTYVLEL